MRNCGKMYAVPGRGSCQVLPSIVIGAGQGAGWSTRFARDAPRGQAPVSRRVEAIWVVIGATKEDPDGVGTGGSAYAAAFRNRSSRMTAVVLATVTIARAER